MPNQGYSGQSSGRYGQYQSYGGSRYGQSGSSYHGNPYSGGSSYYAGPPPSYSQYQNRPSSSYSSPTAFSGYGQAQDRYSGSRYSQGYGNYKQRYGGHRALEEEALDVDSSTDTEDVDSSFSESEEVPDFHFQIPHANEDEKMKK